MATVEVRFSALPAHVRTARLVAAAVARRSGVDEAVLDEVRLAVGEACSRAVDLHRRHCPEQPVEIRLTDDPGAFRVAVHDQAPSAPAGVPASPADALGALADSADPASEGGALDLGGPGDEAVPEGVGIAVITGLVDDVVVRPAPGGGTSVEMTWSAERVAGG
ncbi:ATP-binding protein [Vallicoccus soli]|uniref:ATP-binding protein n=1 Tax=Vallicoccus soli TaxID=2339232 RepID=A0A3A3Z6Y4_9ACTN|nr:ATP-binding protein [Vallicoccus soli]RJK97687.1 ATP-binding protein [Vallicoccus soli]